MLPVLIAAVLVASLGAGAAAPGGSQPVVPGSHPGSVDSQPLIVELYPNPAAHGDDETVRHDLETLEEVVEETEDEQSLPARCPYEHCGAAWRERGIVGINTGNYELLDDGTTVLCLACERTVSLE